MPHKMIIVSTITKMATTNSEFELLSINLVHTFYQQTLEIISLLHIRMKMTYHGIQIA